ncbi:MAG: glycosyltransferase, partial [candidate division Zixibacteria bacterium]|nr:glycosyltransferase [candidate division Zixibacteria bacterium]
MLTKNSMKNSLDKIETKLTGRDIICISSMPYGEMWTRKQRLMTLLAEMGNRVLYAEPADPMFASTGAKGRFSSSHERKGENLFILKPRGRLPFARFNFMRGLNLNLYINEVVKYAQKLEFKNPILFTYLPVIHAHSPFMQVVDKFPDRSLLVYDCVDEHSETIGYSDSAAATVHQWDLDLTKNADVVFVTAKGLYDDRKYLNENLFHSPNGVDVDHFSKALDDSTPLATDIASIPEPRIGFVGSLSDWIDYNLIAGIARNNPNCNVVLVGPLKRGLKPVEFEGLDNIHLLGKKTLDELPSYLKGFACGINPFKRVGISEKVNPLKVYEYLAAGLPVVSIDMPEVMPLSDVVYIARDDEQFLEGVNKVLSGKFAPDPEKLKIVLTRHDWNVI